VVPLLQAGDGGADKGNAGPVGGGGG
jgi:hypothetical protein